MSGIWLDAEQLNEFMTELIGTKLGLAIDTDALNRCFDENHFELPSDGGLMRLRPEGVEELALACLRYFGDPDADHVGFSPLITVSVSNAFKDFPHTLDVMAFAIAELKPLVKGARREPVSVEGILNVAAERWGDEGRAVAKRVFDELNARLFTSPWTSVARASYDTRIELRHLFSSGDLPAAVQEFFDQRFVDYLDANGDDITKMHWRQFERLVAEALVRAGLSVEIGPGGNDNGVDIRAWDPDQRGDESPALLLVQCKREKEKVGKVVVKALAADVAFEGAKVGLVATTSAWSPGARETVHARRYPLVEADNDRIRDWIGAMRTPGAGPWLAG